MKFSPLILLLEPDQIQPRYDRIAKHFRKKNNGVQSPARRPSKARSQRLSLVVLAW